MKIHYQEHKLDDVMRHFADGFRPKPAGSRVVRSEWFVDMAKNTVVFKLYIDESPMITAKKGKINP